MLVKEEVEVLAGKGSVEAIPSKKARLFYVVLTSTRVRPRESDRGQIRPLQRAAIDVKAAVGKDRPGVTYPAHCFTSLHHVWE